MANLYRVICCCLIIYFIYSKRLAKVVRINVLMPRGYKNSMRFLYILGLNKKSNKGNRYISKQSTVSSQQYFTQRRKGAKGNKGYIFFTFSSVFYPLYKSF